MARPWPDVLEMEKRTLTVLHSCCDFCGGPMEVRDYKTRRLYTLEEPIVLRSQAQVCKDETCKGHHKVKFAEDEIQFAPSNWSLAWDVFAHLGQARFARHLSVPEIRDELIEHYSITLSEDCIEDYIGRYQSIVAARQRDPDRLRRHYESVESDELILTIDGLQPEKGHETLYTVREVNGKRVWFGKTLLSSSHDEVEKILVEAKRIAEDLGKPIRAWMSDKQEAFVAGIKKVFPGVPHRYCQNHFLRDVAKPVLEADSSAKVDMRKKVRGLRTIEKEILQRQSEREGEEKVAAEGQEILDYCAATRGILNKNQGGPLDPPGLKMADGLKDVQASIQRVLDKGIGGQLEKDLGRLLKCIERGLSEVEGELERVSGYVEDLKQIDHILGIGEEKPKRGLSAKYREARFKKRRDKFEKLSKKFLQDEDPIRQQMGAIMKRFLHGLFAGGPDLNFLNDNLDLERWFRNPKSHERKIHGRQHAGVRIVHEGPSLVLVLDAHLAHPRPFSEEELEPYFGAMPTEEELQAVERRKIMRRATSRKSRPVLLNDLERRCEATLRQDNRAKV